MRKEFLLTGGDAKGGKTLFSCFELLWYTKTMASRSVEADTIYVCSFICKYPLFVDVLFNIARCRESLF